MQTFRKADKSLGWILDEGSKTMFMVFSALALGICIAYQCLVVAYPYSMDYGEAPLVDQAMHLASGQNIYRADISTPPYTISNYPPLYVTLLAISVKLFGPASSFLIGRILSALCAWAASLCISLIVYAQTRDCFAGLCAGLIFLAFPYVVYWSPLLRIDMLALALSLGGLCLLVQEHVSSRRLTIVTLLLVAAIYTRQSYALTAPFAAFVWLLARDWKQAIRFAGWVGGLSLGFFLLLNAWTRGGFFFNIVTANVNEFKLDQLKYYWDQVRKNAFILLCVGFASLFLPRRLNPLWTLSAPYLIGATLSAATIGKIGSNVNYLLELCAALSLAAGAVIAWSRAHLSLHSLRAALLFLLAIAVGRMIHFTLQDRTGDLRDRRAAISEVKELNTLVGKMEGPILADEYMGMLTQQGQPLYIQPFEVTQLAWAGKWDQTPFLESIRNKEFSAIIIYDKPWASERWTEEMFDAINGSYILSDVIAGNRIYKTFQRRETTSLRICPGAVWQLPGDTSLGVKWQGRELDFFGQGNEGGIPVYVVADGLLTRLPGLMDAVAIQHDDPLHPGEKVWSYYGGMSAANGADSFVAEEFPVGVENVPVKAGQVLGQQGTWSGTPQWSMWAHVRFAVVRATAQGEFPMQMTLKNMLDPTQYLGLALSDNTNFQALECRQP
jgi:hypothetical protein